MMPNMQNFYPTWLNASYYQNIPHHEINWAQLAQQWMTMKTAENRFMNVAAAVQHTQPAAVFAVPPQQLPFPVSGFPPPIVQQPEPPRLQLPPSASVPVQPMHTMNDEPEAPVGAIDSSHFSTNLLDQKPDMCLNYVQQPQRTPLFTSFDGGTGPPFTGRPVPPQAVPFQQPVPGHSTGLLPTPPSSQFRPPPLMLNQVMPPPEYVNFNRPPAPDYQQTSRAGGGGGGPAAGFTTYHQNCFTSDDEGYGLSGPFAEQYHGSFADEQFFGQDMDYRKWRPPLLENEYTGSYATESYDMNGDNSVMFDMQQRKLLPLWIREGLEKMEKERQKQKEKEDRDEYLKNKLAAKRERLAMEGKSRFEGSDSDEESDVHDGVKEDADLQASTSERLKEETHSDRDDEDDSQEISVEEQRIHLMAKLRKWLTEILMDVTTKEIETIVFETHKSKLKRAQPKVLAQTSALVTITSLGADYGSGTDDEDDDNDSDDDVDESKPKSETQNFPSASAPDDETSFKRPLFPVSAFVSKRNLNSTVNGTATTVENTSNEKDGQSTTAESSTLTISLEHREKSTNDSLTKSSNTSSKSQKSDKTSSTDKHHHHHHHRSESSSSSSKHRSDARKRSRSNSPKRYSDSASSSSSSSKKRSRTDNDDRGDDDEGRSGHKSSSSSSSSKRRSRSKSKDRKKEKSHKSHHSDRSNRSDHRSSSSSSKKSKKSSRSRSKSKERSKHK